MTQQICENCGKPNPVGESYCYACGHILATGQNALLTRNLDEDMMNLHPQLRWGTAYFGERMVLRLYVRDSGDMLETTFMDACVIGREHSEGSPDVDLSVFGARDMGVSRRHVRLTRKTSTIMVEDLDSSNGTFLNGQKLVPYQPRVLRNEDVLTLGRLELRVSYIRKPTGGLVTSAED